MSDLQISGPSSVLPEQQPAPEYVVSWQGGTAPWTVVFDASDPGFNRRQEIDVPAQAYCTSAGFQTGCGTFPIQVLYGTPQISRISRVRYSMCSIVVDGSTPRSKRCEASVEKL